VKVKSDDRRGGCLEESAFKVTVAAYSKLIRWWMGNQ